MTQKLNCEKCMKDLHDECADPESCLCAETHNKAPTLEQLATEQINKISIKELKESAREGRLSTTIQQNKKQIHIQILNHDIRRLRPQSQIDGIYYFRVDLPVEKTIISERENEKIYTFESYFVTSEKKLIHYKDSELVKNFQMPLMVPFPYVKWNVDDILHFIETTTKTNPSIVYADNEMKLRKIIDYKMDGHYAVVTLWIIGTYFSKLFAYYPYLDFTGTKGSAKTKSIDFCTQLMFYGIMFNQVSGASAYRVIEGTGCSIGLDETEYLKDPKSEKAQFILTLLKGAFKTDSKSMVNIQTKDGWVPWFFDSGTCIAMGHISGLDDVLEDRVIPILMLTTLRKEIANTEIDKDDPFWLKQRGQLYRLALENFKEIIELKSKPYNSNIISNRELNQIWKPIITLARFFENHGVKDLLKRIGPVINEAHNKKILTDQSSNLDTQILEALVKLYKTKSITCEENHKSWYRQESIFNQCKLEEGLEWITSSRFVGNCIDRLGFHRKKWGDSGKCVYLDNEILIDICKRHYIPYDDLVKQDKLASFTSSASFHEQQNDEQNDVNDQNDGSLGLRESNTFEEKIEERAQIELQNDVNDQNDGDIK